LKNKPNSRHYDSKQDPIVRTEASRLRARLSEYYLADGPDIKGFLGYAYGRAGRRDEAEKLAAA